MVSIDEIKEKINLHIGDKVRIVFNGSRNKVEEYNATISETYPFVFVVKIDGNDKKHETKSFSYSDVLTQTIEIYFK